MRTVWTMIDDVLHIHSAYVSRTPWGCLGKVCGWMLGTRRHKITFKVSEDILSPKLWLVRFEGVSHGLAGRPPPKSTNGEGYDGNLL
ncbi:MAG: hypothetical protein QXH12_03095 [Candidatus Caldarchaeum sp.]